MQESIISEADLRNRFESDILTSTGGERSTEDCAERYDSPLPR